jgi:hypothetical protein
LALIFLVNTGNVRIGIGPANAGMILQGRTSLIRQRSILCGDMIFLGRQRDLCAAAALQIVIQIESDRDLLQHFERRI